MSERPILFRPEMVRAILDGRKTQTRRIVKLPDAPNHLGEWEATTIGGDGSRYPDRTLAPKMTAIWHTRTADCLTCHYGQPGDRLWVKERWRPVATNHKQWTSVLYFADGEQRDCPYFKVNFAKAGARPSIHMPRVASRLTLEITEVRVERVQDISEADAQAEGCWRSRHPDLVSIDPPEFRLLWDEVHSKDGCGWDVNPWVWVVSFRPDGRGHRE